MSMSTPALSILPVVSLGFILALGYVRLCNIIISTDVSTNTNTTTTTITTSSLRVEKYINNTANDLNNKVQSATSPTATYIDEDGVCVNALPYATLHHEDLIEVERYQALHIERAGGYASSYGGRGLPELKTLPPLSSFSLWDCEKKNDCDLSFNSINNIKGSAWTADGKEAFAKHNQSDTHPSVIWVDHHKYEYLGTKNTTLKGDTAAMFGFYPTNFGHVLYDNFPLLAFLKSTLPEHTTFALPDTKLYRELITFIDPSFMDRIYFYQSNEIITVEDGNLTVANPKGGRFLGSYGNTLLRYMRHWIFDNHPETYPNDEKYLIFYSRGVGNGRKLDSQHERDVIMLIKANMVKYHRNERLIVFTGNDEKGNPLSYTEKFNIFRHASTIIGPHGSDLANVVWSNPFPESCQDRVHILEFIAGTEAEQLHGPKFNGYYWVLRGLPADWHQITYASNSTQQQTFIQLDSLQRALDDIWGSKETSEKLEAPQKMLEEYTMAYPAESVERLDNVTLFEPAQDILQSEWCTAPTEPPIPYKKCRWDSIVMKFGVYGGLTNALGFILKGAIWAMEEDVCFFVSELHGKYGVSKLAHREPPEETVTPFLERYFEPIGIPEDHEKVVKAQFNEIFEPHYHQIQYHEYGRRSAGIAKQGSPYRSKHLRRDLDFLNLWDVDNVWLKKHIMRRLLRILPERREESCSRLKDNGLDGKYIALSVRRGDKVLEFELESSMKPYIDAVEEATQTHFDGTVPTIFVASDDCSVMQELREMRRDWNFVSECYKMDSHGFFISQMKHWTLKETDDHYNKFLTELIAMASATYFIGVKTTNVSLFVYFMRHYDQGDDSWKFIDAPNEFVF